MSLSVITCRHMQFGVCMSWTHSVCVSMHANEYICMCHVIVMSYSVV